MAKKYFAGFFFFVLLGILFLPFLMAIENTVPPMERAEYRELWETKDTEGKSKVRFWFFWSESCPHCQVAHPFIDAIPEKLDFVKLESRAIDNKEGIVDYFKISKAAGDFSTAVPAFAYCGKIRLGYKTAETTGAEIMRGLKDCKRELEATSK